MGIQVIEQLGGVGGRLGKGLAQSLSEQLPKEVARHRLTSGLEKLKNEPGKTPVDRLIQLYGVPGITPEIAGQVEPYLRSMAASEETKSQPQGNAFGGTTQPGIAPSGNEPLNLRSGGLEDLQTRGAELYRTKPNLYPTLESGMEGAKAEFALQEKNIENVKSDFNEILAKKIQKNGTDTFGDVLGDLQNKFLNQAYQDIQNGAHPKQAANKYAEKAKNFAMSMQQLKTIGDTHWMSQTPSSNRKQINAIRQKFDEENQLEPFKDQLIATQKLSEPHASYVAYPVKNNKKIASYLDEIKPKKGFSIEATRYGKENQEAKIAENIANNIGDSDSLLSIALELQNKNLNPQKFIDSIEDMYNQDKISLTERQRRELGKNRNFKETMSDIYLNVLTGK